MAQPAIASRGKGIRMKTQNIRVKLRDGEMGAYLAIPDRTPAGAVVAIMEISGASTTPCGRTRTSSRKPDILVSSARLPLCEWPDIGNFTALVGPGIDRPEFVGLAILDHCRIVRTLSE